MYFEAGDTGEAATIMLEKRSSTDGRTWNIKVTYIECTNDLLPPAGCTQYYTGLSGNIQAYNYGRMLADQLYSMCIRREEGKFVCKDPVFVVGAIEKIRRFLPVSNRGIRCGPAASLLDHEDPHGRTCPSGSRGKGDRFKPPSAPSQ